GFLANRTPTAKRPSDERSFQIKYGSKADNSLHAIWQDPYGLYTTLLLGIDVSEGFFIGVDPEMHNPTRLFIRFEFKDGHVAGIQKDGWHVWDRRKAGSNKETSEVIVGGTRRNFL